MSASVVSLATARKRYANQRWSNHDLAEIYRVADTLQRAGLPVDCEEGTTDEGDPWYAFCNANSGDVIIHFAFIDGRYVAEIAHLGISFQGDQLRDIVSQFLNSYPVILPSKQGAASRVWMHPSSAFVAFIATLYFLLEMSNSAEARESTSVLTIDGETDSSGSDPSFELVDGPGSHSIPYRDPFLRLVRSDGSSSDGVRALAVSAVVLIAGALIDWHRSSGNQISFEPESILNAILTKSGEEFGDALVEALRATIGDDQNVEAGRDQPQDGAAIRTAHLVDSDHDLDIALADLGKSAGDNSEAGLLIDLEGGLGETGRAIGAELLGEYGADSEYLRDGKVLSAGAAAEERLADTIAASVREDEAQDSSEEGSGQASGSSSFADGDSLASQEALEYNETASESSTTTLLQSLGLQEGSSGSLFETELASLVKLIEKPLTEETAAQSESSPVVASSPVLVGDTPVSTPVAGSEVDVSGAATSDPGGFDTTADGGVDDPQPSSSTPQISDVAKTLGQTLQPSGSGGGSGIGTPAEPITQDLDFSIFDPLDVMRAFVQSVSKVGFAHLDEIYYLYDAVALAEDADNLEFEQFHLENGEEVNLLGQAETFDSIYDALA